jgi:hypothetical protein
VFAVGTNDEVRTPSTLATSSGRREDRGVLDEVGAEAVRLMDEFLSDPEDRLDLLLAPGPDEHHDEPERRGI